MIWSVLIRRRVFIGFVVLVAMAATGPTPTAHGGFDRPPPVTILWGDQSAELEPWTWCYGNTCADGAPPENPVHVGSPEQVMVDYSLRDWTFKAYFTPAGEPCGRTQSARLEELADGRFVVTPRGYAGTYDVTLAGRGRDGGDLFVTFRWTTPFDGPLPKPKAYIGVVTDDDGEYYSYGAELSIWNMATTPEKARATITVTSAEKRSITFDATDRRRRCMAEGSLWWAGPYNKARQAAKLGSAPFEYKVVLTMDGKRYRAKATWPDDEIRWLAPYVWLNFRPKLPALR